MLAFVGLKQYAEASICPSDVCITVSVPKSNEDQNTNSEPNDVFPWKWILGFHIVTCCGVSKHEEQYKILSVYT